MRDAARVVRTGQGFGVVGGILHAGNVADAARTAGASGFDVSSGVERAPGVKDSEMIRDFIRAVRASRVAEKEPS